jgi:hypothetical protein
MDRRTLRDGALRQFQPAEVSGQGAGHNDQLPALAADLSRRQPAIQKAFAAPRTDKELDFSKVEGVPQQ